MTHLKVGCIEEYSEGSDVGSPLPEPLLDRWLGEVDGDRQTHSFQERGLAVS